MLQLGYNNTVLLKIVVLLAWEIRYECSLHTNCCSSRYCQANEKIKAKAK